MADCSSPQHKPAGRRQAWAEAAALTLLVGLPLIVSAAAIAWPGTPQRLACGDDGNIELFTWYVFHGGQLSGIRIHGNLAEHLGPLYFYLLAPLYALFGCRHAGLQWGAILINLLAIGGVLGVARRSGGRGAMLWAGLLLACYVRFAGLPWLTSVWLPWVVILPFLATVFLFAAVASGRLLLLPVAVFAASFIVQTQLGYSLVLAAALLLTLLSLLPWVRSRVGFRRLPSGRLVKALAATALVAAIAWTPPAIKQVRGMRGRISETLGFLAAQGVSHSWQEAATTLSSAMAAFPVSLAGAAFKTPRIADSFDRLFEHRAIVVVLATAEIVLLPLSFLLARRRREFDAALSLLSAALVPLCLVSLRRLAGNVLFHHVFWMTALGLLNVYVIGGALFACLSDRARFWTLLRHAARNDAQREAQARPPLLPSFALGVGMDSRIVASRAAAVLTLMAIGLISLASVVDAARELPRIRGQAFDLYMHDQEDARIEGGDEGDAARFLERAGQWLRGRGIVCYRLRIIGLHRSGVATGMILGLTKQGLPPLLDPWYADVFAPQAARPSQSTSGVLLLCNRRQGKQFQERLGLETVVESEFAVLLWSGDDAVVDLPGSGDRL